MENALEIGKKIMEILPYATLYLVLGATFVTRLTPTKSDDEKIDKFLSKLNGIFRYLPTIGVNPRTAQLEAEIERLKSLEKK